MQKTSLLYYTSMAFFIISTFNRLYASDEITIRNNEELQPEISILLDSLSPEEQEQCLQLLNQAACLIEESEKDPEPNDNLVTNLHNIMTYIATSRLPIISIKLLGAIIFWEIIKPRLESNKENNMGRSTLEAMTVLVGLFCIDDIKDLLKEAKKTSEDKLVHWQKKLFSPITA